MTDLWISGVAGASAGLFCDTLLHPIDTIKTRIQCQTGFWISPQIFRGVYNGLGALTVGSVPSSALFFMIYDRISNDSANPLVHVGAAFVAEFFASAVRVPSEVVKQRAQVRSESCRTSSLGMLQRIVHTNGWSILYTGFMPTIFRDISFAIIQFPIYEYLKRYYNIRHESPAWKAGLCGSVAGAVAGVITCPIDVLKTRQMVGHSSATLKSIINNEGILSFFEGVIPRTMWISIGAVLWLGCYEKVKSSIRVVV